MQTSTTDHKEIRAKIKKIEHSLGERIKYEKMLANISLNSLVIKNVDRFIEYTLSKLSDTLDVSRIYVAVFDADSHLIQFKYDWYAKGLKRLNRNKWHMPLTEEAFKKRETISIENIDGLPDSDEKLQVQNDGCKSLLSIPLFLKEDLYGCIGFDENRRYRKWTKEDTYILSTVAQILSKTIESKHHEKMSEENRDRLKAIFNSVHEGIITIDKDMRVTEVNKYMENICGFSSDIIIGKSFEDCMNSCDKSCYELVVDAIQKNKDIKEAKIECRSSNKRKQYIIINNAPLIDIYGKSMGSVMTFRDVTTLTRLEDELQGRYKIESIVGKSKKMQYVFDLVESLADVETTVLITGESGTGKEIVAKALHHAGIRRQMPFVTVNCMALSESLLESELFGHVKGSFTGAINDRIGRFESAQDGTIFLDEIGHISPLLQLKLLRVLQEREFERVGESITRKTNARVIAATNVALKDQMKKGGFREDLYYRLNVVEIKLPLLRDRYEDIPLLVEHFCKAYNKQFKKNILGVSNNVLKMFYNYNWPGNVRELQHIIERAFILSKKDQIIKTMVIPDEIANYTANYYPIEKDRNRPSHINKHSIMKALEATKWNVTKAASMLNIHRTTLHRKIERYRLGRPTKIM